MEDLILSAKLDEHTTLRVSPIAPETFLECVGDDTLGSGDGYFVLLSRKSPVHSAPEVLAKARDFDSAETLFNMIVRSTNMQAYA